MEDFTQLLAFVSGGSVVAAILTGLLKKWIKDTILPRYGDSGVLAVLLIISFLIAAGFFGFKFLPKDIILTATMIFSGSIAVYQVLVKAIYRKLIKGKLDTGE